MVSLQLYAPLQLSIRGRKSVGSIDGEFLRLVEAS